jgi:lysophospholipase L1-like esterase
MVKNWIIASALLSCASCAIAQVLEPAWVRTSGRMVETSTGSWLATWPGVNWTVRFRGEAIGVRLSDSENYWVLEIDGHPSLHIAPLAGERTVWLRNLAPGEHTAQLVKRTESPHKAAHILGFELDGGTVLPPLPAPARRIEFIGDSYTAAMGNVSTSTVCSPAQISERTDITQGFAVLTARALNAEWQIHAKSGMGLVRNWGGGVRDENFGTHYARAIQSDPSSQPNSNWKPDTVIIGLGTNDFSTLITEGEPRNAAQLETDFLQAYRALLSSVRTRYGDPLIVLISLPLARGDKLRPLVRRLLDEQHAAGYQRIHGLDWGVLRAGGCLSHPDAVDHRHMADLLLNRLKELR